MLMVRRKLNLETSINNVRVDRAKQLSIVAVIDLWVKFFVFVNCLSGLALTLPYGNICHDGDNQGNVES
jgi:hypothetical protein